MRFKINPNSELIIKEVHKKDKKKQLFYLQKFVIIEDKDINYNYIEVYSPKRPEIWPNIIKILSNEFNII